MIWLLSPFLGLAIGVVALLLGFDAGEALVAGLTALLMMAGLLVHHRWYVNR